MFTYDPGFHAALLQLLLGSEDIWEIEKKIEKQSGKCLCWDLYDFFYVYVLVKFVLEIVSVCVCAHVWWYMCLAAGLRLSPGYCCSKM